MQFIIDFYTLLIILSGLVYSRWYHLS